MIITDYSIVQEYEERINRARLIEKYKNRCIVIGFFILVEICVLIALITQSDFRDVAEPEPTTNLIPLSEAVPILEDTAHIEDPPYIYLSSEDKKEFATLIYLEAGIESYECKLGVASVVINRMTMYGQTFDEVVYAPNQFSPASLIPYYEPTQECVDAVNEIIQYGPTIPEYVTFFRADYYFDWGDRYSNYTCMDHTYFSYDNTLKAYWESIHAV